MSLDPDAATTIVAELTKAYDAAGVQKPPALTPGAPGFGMAGPLGGAPQGFGQGGYGGQMGEYRMKSLGAVVEIDERREAAAGWACSCPSLCDLRNGPAIVGDVAVHSPVRTHRET